MKYDENNVPYTEEIIEDFISDCYDEDTITLTIRKYPKRYFISWEVFEHDSPYPMDAAEAEMYYVPPSVYLWKEKYLHRDFESRRDAILTEIREFLEQKYYSW